MISSMTGYGQSQIDRGKVRCGVEIRSVNNRFMDVQIRLPRFLQSLEAHIRDTVQRAISRGKINLSLTWEGMEEGAIGVSLDQDAAMAYHKLITELKVSLGLEDDVGLNHLLSFSEIFKQDKKEWDLEKAWAVAKEAVEIALEDLQRLRFLEGEQLQGDMTRRINRLEEIILEIERLQPQKADQALSHLREKITKLLDSQQVDEQRLAMEVALMAEKADITEECVRFHSHNKLFLSMLEEAGPVGRKLTFLLQEMNREANTMGSKVNDVQVAHQVVEIKEEIERIREQVQNVE